MGKYLDFYNKCMATGRIPACGLCNSLDRWDVSVFAPHDDIEDSNYCWGYDGEPTLPRLSMGVELPGLNNSFTPLRQTIVLFLAAMNDEL
jgi:hypothetical protein